MDGFALTVGLVFAGLAAAVHVCIWVLESILWDRPSTRRTFGVRSDADAETLRPMAYNQGYYNLFLALGAAAGIVLTGSTIPETGLVLALFACLSMMLAALVLITSNRRMARAALVQGVLPLVAVVLLGAELTVRLA